MYTLWATQPNLVCRGAQRVPTPMDCLRSASGLLSTSTCAPGFAKLDSLHIQHSFNWLGPWPMACGTIQSLFLRLFNWLLGPTVDPEKEARRKEGSPPKEVRSPNVKLRN